MTARAPSLELDYPPTADNRPRYGHGRPVHPRIEAILDSYATTFRRELTDLWSFRPQLEAIAIHESPGLEPYWRQDWIAGLDGVALYGYARLRSPARYVEVGSGMSTRFVARAIRDASLGTRIMSIDPEPRQGIDALCDDIIRLPLELAGDGWLRELRAGDMLFVDGSHRAFMNSDVTVFFIEILPQLPAGVLVGFDDIWWPEDYPPDWADRYYSEQYLLACYLLAGCPWLTPKLACRYVNLRPELGGMMADFWEQPERAGDASFGLTFWAETTGNGPSR